MPVCAERVFFFTVFKHMQYLTFCLRFYYFVLLYNSILHCVNTPSTDIINVIMICVCVCVYVLHSDNIYIHLNVRSNRLNKVAKSVIVGYSRSRLHVVLSFLS